MAPFVNDLKPPDEQVAGVAPASGRQTSIFLIKVAHSLIYLFMSACLVYLYYAALTRTYDGKLVFAMSMIGLETLILLVSGRRCPLSTYARRLGDETGNDLLGDYLPQWAVRRTVPICTLVLTGGSVLLFVSYLLSP